MRCKHWIVVCTLCVLAGTLAGAAHVQEWLTEVAPIATAYDIVAPNVEDPSTQAGHAAGTSKPSGTAEEAWVAWLDRARALVAEASKVVQQMHPALAEGNHLSTYEQAVAKVHAADAFLSKAPQAPPAAGSLDALKQEVAHAHEVLAGAEERLKDSGVYAYHGARLTAEKEVMTALQELEDARQYLGFIGHTLESGHAAGADAAAHPQVVQAGTAPLRKVFSTLQSGAKALGRWAHELKALGKRKLTRSKEVAVESAQPAGAGSDASCVATDLRYDQAHDLLSTLDQAMEVMRKYEHVDHALAEEEAATVVQTAMAAFQDAVRHMEAWQVQALKEMTGVAQPDQDSAQAAVNQAAQPHLELVRIAVAVVQEEPEPAAPPAAATRVNRWMQGAKQWAAEHKLWPWGAKPAAQAAS